MHVGHIQLDTFPADMDSFGQKHVGKTYKVDNSDYWFFVEKGSCQGSGGFPWKEDRSLYDSTCCNFDLESGSQTKKKETKNTQGATRRRPKMNILLHKSDIVSVSYDSICLLSRLEIYLSLSLYFLTLLQITQIIGQIQIIWVRSSPWSGVCFTSLIATN